MNFKFTAFQKTDEGKTIIELSTVVTRQNLSQVCGNMLTELFSWVQLQRRINASGLKLSLPVCLKFEYKGKIYDSSKWKIELQNKLKLQNTGNGKKIFAQRFFAIFEWLVTERKNTNFVELIEACEQELQAELN